MTTIRTANENDVSQLEKLFLEIRKQTFTWDHPDKFKLEDYKKSTEGEIVFVAEENMEILGFISIWAQDNFIHNLFIRHNRQNEGIGKLLLNKAIEQFPPPLYLKVVTHNTKACHFYEKHGWEKLSTHKDAPEPYHLYKYK